MAKYQVPGQDNMQLAVGAVGDKTITIPIATTHVRVTNLGDIQPVKYSVVAAPAYPADWADLSPRQQVIVKMIGGNLYLRKRVFFRYSSIGQTRNDPTYVPPEVKQTIEVEPFTIS